MATKPCNYSATCTPCEYPTLNLSAEGVDRYLWFKRFTKKTDPPIGPVIYGSLSCVGWCYSSVSQAAADACAEAIDAFCGNGDVYSSIAAASCPPGYTCVNTSWTAPLAGITVTDTGIQAEEGIFQGTASQADMDSAAQSYIQNAFDTAIEAGELECIAPPSYNPWDFKYSFAQSYGQSNSPTVPESYFEMLSETSAHGETYSYQTGTDPVCGGPLMSADLLFVHVVYGEVDNINNRTLRINTRMRFNASSVAGSYDAGGMCVDLTLFSEYYYQVWSDSFVQLANEFAVSIANGPYDLNYSHDVSIPAGSPPSVYLYCFVYNGGVGSPALIDIDVSWV